MKPHSAIHNLVCYGIMIAADRIHSLWIAVLSWFLYTPAIMLRLQSSNGPATIHTI